MKALWFAAAALILSACNQGTGILPAGPDTYTVTERLAPILGGGQEAERKALTEANSYCAARGRQFVPMQMNQAGNLRNPYGPDGYTVTFGCLQPNDPRVAHFNLQPSPNVIIEQRNR